MSEELRGAAPITENELANTLYERHTSDREPLDWTAVARHAAELLGVELAPEPLKSGVYRHEDGRLVHLSDYSTLSVVEAHVDSPWAKRNRDKLTPARVVPAEPVELSEEDLIRAYPGGVPYAYGSFINFPNADRSALLRMCQTLAAKHGHGRVEIDWGDVRNAVASCTGNGWGLTGEPINAITDAVMALLGGDDRGE